MMIWNKMYSHDSAERRIDRKRQHHHRNHFLDHTIGCRAVEDVWPDRAGQFPVHLLSNTRFGIERHRTRNLTIRRVEQKGVTRLTTMAWFMLPEVIRPYGRCLNCCLGVSDEGSSPCLISLPKSNPHVALRAHCYVVTPATAWTRGRGARRPEEDSYSKNLLVYNRVESSPPSIWFQWIERLLMLLALWRRRASRSHLETLASHWPGDRPNGDSRMSTSLIRGNEASKQYNQLSKMRDGAPLSAKWTRMDFGDIKSTTGILARNLQVGKCL